MRNEWLKRKKSKQFPELVKLRWPILSPEKICSVQPLLGPTGLMYYKRFLELVKR